MNWKFYNLLITQNFDLDFQNKIRDVFVDAFYSGKYPTDKPVWKSLPKRFKKSTHLFILLSDNASNRFEGYAFFTVPENKLNEKSFIWEDGIAIRKHLQGKSHSKDVYDLINTQIENSGWFGGRTQNPAIIRAYCKKGKSFPFDENYSTESGKEVMNFLKKNISEVKESKGISIKTGICKKIYREGKLGDYKNDWTGIEMQEAFLKKNKFEQGNGDAVIIAVQLKPIIIFDSNIWLSFMIGKTILKLKDRIAEGKFKVIVTERLIVEIKDVAPRERFKKYFKQNDLPDFLNYLESISSKIKIKSEVSICRDEKDNYLLALAQDSKADYIVTGDKDLLTLEKFGKTEIIRFAKFNELFEN